MISTILAAWLAVSPTSYQFALERARAEAELHADWREAGALLDRVEVNAIRLHMLRTIGRLPHSS